MTYDRYVEKGLLVFQTYIYIQEFVLTVCATNLHPDDVQVSNGKGTQSARYHVFELAGVANI